jgi:hypothetical protein
MAVTVRSNVLVCGRSIAGITGSNPADCIDFSVLSVCNVGSSLYD